MIKPEKLSLIDRINLYADGCKNEEIPARSFDFTKEDTNAMISALEMVQKIAAMDYPHNFQKETYDLVEFCYKSSAIIQMAKSIQKAIDIMQTNQAKHTNYLQAAIDTYGSDNQTDVAIEEMAELTQALIHNRRGRPANIAEEIADVEIMLEQLKIIHGCADEVEKQKDAKIKRLAFKLKEGDKD